MAPRTGVESDVSKALRWLNNYAAVSKWMRQYSAILKELKNGGLLKLEGFFPPFVAKGVLTILAGIEDENWNATAAREDYTHNNIEHKFWSTKAGAEGLDTVFRALGILLPQLFHTFSAGRYQAGHHIAPHDDRAYTSVRTDTGKVITCSRDVTMVYYLTHGWREDMGGCFVDLEDPGGPKHYVPTFNSAVLFRVPRYHQVTPVLTDKPRYSIFGWYLRPGQLYELYAGEQHQPQLAHQQRIAQGVEQQAVPGEQQLSDPQRQGKQRRRQQSRLHSAGVAGMQQKEEQQDMHGVRHESERRQRLEPDNRLRTKSKVGRRRRGNEEPQAWCKLAQRLLAMASKRQRAGGSEN